MKIKNGFSLCVPDLMTLKSRQQILVSLLQAPYVSAFTGWKRKNPMLLSI